MNDTLDWQTLIAMCVVIAAVAYLARQGWRLASSPKKSSCGGCGSCASNSTATASSEGFVPLEQLAAKKGSR